MKAYAIQTNSKRKSARYDYILHQNCKTNCKTQKTYLPIVPYSWAFLPFFGISV